MTTPTATAPDPVRTLAATIARQAGALATGHVEGDRMSAHVDSIAAHLDTLREWLAPSTDLTTPVGRDLVARTVAGLTRSGARSMSKPVNGYAWGLPSTLRGLERRGIAGPYALTGRVAPYNTRALLTPLGLAVADEINGSES